MYFVYQLRMGGWIQRLLTNLTQFHLALTRLSLLSLSINKQIHSMNAALQNLKMPRREEEKQKSSTLEWESLVFCLEGETEGVKSWWEAPSAMEAWFWLWGVVSETDMSSRVSCNFFFLFPGPLFPYSIINYSCACADEMSS